MTKCFSFTFFSKAKTKHEQKFIHTHPLLAILTGLLIHNVWFLCIGKKLDRIEAISFPPNIQMMLFFMQSHKFVNTMCPLSLSCRIKSLLLWQWHMIFACCTFLTLAVTQHLCCSVASSGSSSCIPHPYSMGRVRDTYDMQLFLFCCRSGLCLVMLKSWVCSPEDPWGEFEMG